MAKLNIVDEEGNIIGEDTRENVHKKGLLHREIHVWFYTPKGEIVFQLRGKNKDTFPNLLASTVGGHVDLDDSFEDAAVREVKEETGLDVKMSDLQLVNKVRKTARDKVTGMTNNVIRNIYAYLYTGDIEDLEIEGDKGQGFEAWSIDYLVKGLSEAESKKFIPSLLGKEYISLYKKIEKLNQ